MIRHKALILCAMMFFCIALVNAQGNNGRGKCMQPFGISFYLVEGGFEDEWLDLYMKWHYPLMQYALDNEALLQHKLFVPDGHVLPIREIKLSSGAEFIVVICGSIMTMPGLPRVPAANSIKLNEKGEIEGLF